jgi:hypothetical protein
METERFVWTDHARLRLGQRRLDATEVEQAIRSGHADREENDGRAGWQVNGVTADGVAFDAIYDHPHGDDDAAVRIVSVWRLSS